MIEEYCCVEDSLTGRGVFATHNIASHCPVAQFGGEKITLNQIPDGQLNYVARVDRDHYRIPGEPARFINHSCAPNCHIDDELRVVTSRAIAQGEELTIAYNQVSMEEFVEWGDFWHPLWTFRCQCGHARCQGEIIAYSICDDDSPFYMRRALPRDFDAVRSIAADTGVFTAEELGCLEIDFRTTLDEQRRSATQDYQITWCHGEAVVGHLHAGPMAMTEGTWMVYWIFASPHHHGQGLGKRMLTRALQLARTAGARRVFLETSELEAYAPARKCYLKSGFTEVAHIPEFYGTGNAKKIFGIDLRPETGNSLLTE